MLRVLWLIEPEALGDTRLPDDSRGAIDGHAEALVQAADLDLYDSFFFIPYHVFLYLLFLFTIEHITKHSLFCFDHFEIYFVIFP